MMNAKIHNNLQYNKKNSSIMTMNSHQQPTITLVSSTLPSLDPNGQPYSMILRGEVAELRELESTLSSNPDTRQRLLEELQESAGCRASGSQDEFADAEIEDDNMNRIDNNSSSKSIGCDDSQSARENKKRVRDDDEDEIDGSSCDEQDFEYKGTEKEQLICYIPSMECTCSSWDMKCVKGELLVTSIRVLFIAQGENQKCHDVAIDGRCIALHAMDSEPSSEEHNNDTSLSHIYCQLCDSSVDENNVGYPSASLGMLAPTNIEEEDYDGSCDQIIGAEDNISVNGGTFEVYFKPIDCQNEENCQAIFDALSHLASLNAVEDSNENGGGLFSMLSMMAGIGEFGSDGMIVADDDDDESDGDDDMVVRFGGGNNLVENDDDSGGASESERAAMLRRLDDMLVVPPELRISSDDEGGQFDDADEEDDDDEIL